MKDDPDGPLVMLLYWSVLYQVILGIRILRKISPLFKPVQLEFTITCSQELPNHHTSSQCLGTNKSELDSVVRDANGLVLYSN